MVGAAALALAGPAQAELAAGGECVIDARYELLRRDRNAVSVPVVGICDYGFTGWLVFNCTRHRASLVAELGETGQSIDFAAGSVVDQVYERACRLGGLTPAPVAPAATPQWAPVFPSQNLKNNEVDL